MRKHIMRRVCGGLLAAALVLSAAIPPGTASYAAAAPKDVKGHWAQKYIEKAISAGIVAGYTDGNFRPENQVTRAEFAHMLNAALGNTGTAAASFKDVKQSDWYYGDVSKAVAAGYTNGYDDGTFGPNRGITRQEAAIMLSMVVPTYGSSATLTGYPDYNQISTWARSGMARMVGKGYINVYTNDKKLHPKDKMTRAQAATIIVSLLEKESIVKSPTSVAANGASLSNTIYSNGVTITRTSGSGSAELNKCIVLGTLSVTGGQTVTLNNSRVSQVTVQSSDDVSVVARGETYVKNASVANTAALQTSSLSGDAVYGAGFANVSIVKNAILTLSGSYPKVNLDGSSSNVTLTSGTVSNLTAGSGASGSNFTIESSATVTAATAASAIAFHGTGRLTKLTANASGITYETKPGSVTLGRGVAAPTQNDAGTSVKVSPVNGRTGVDVDTEITLTFSSAMRLYNGDSIGRSDIEDFVELRRSSPNGSKIDFTASIDSAKKVITIEPDDYLDDDIKYYISIDRGELKDADGDANSSFSSWFTTGDSSSGSSVSDYMTFTPRDGSRNIYVGTRPRIEFTEPMLCYDGTSVRDSDLSDIITFREGGSSGSKVDFSASISSDKETITIVPDDDLERDTRYYLAVDSRSLKTADRGTVVPAASVVWTTGDDDDDDDDDDDYVTFNPRDDRENIAVDIEPEIQFSEKMECYDGSTITNSDLKDIVIFRSRNARGSDINFSASIDSAKKVITVTPEDELEYDEDYYLAIASKTLRTASDGDSVSAASATWTTGDEKDDDSDYVSFYPRDDKEDVDRYVEPTIRFSERVEFYNGDSISSGRNEEIEDDCIRFEDEDGDDVDFRAYYNTSRYEITLEPEDRLSSNTEYTITVLSRSFQTRSDEDAIPSCSVTWTTE